MKTIGLFLTLFCATNLAFGQDKPAPPLLEATEIAFKDTIFDFVFDSVVHHLGTIDPLKTSGRLTKYFKYIGTDTMIIARPFTGDPHFICNYPKGPLVPNKIYSYTICFYHKGRKGKLNKSMGFQLLDGTRVVFRFRGEYL